MVINREMGIVNQAMLKKEGGEEEIKIEFEQILSVIMEELEDKIAVSEEELSESEVGEIEKMKKDFLSLSKLQKQIINLKKQKMEGWGNKVKIKENIIKEIVGEEKIEEVKNIIEKKEREVETETGESTVVEEVEEGVKSEIELPKKFDAILRGLRNFADGDIEHDEKLEIPWAVEEFKKRKDRFEGLREKLTNEEDKSKLDAGFTLYSEICEKFENRQNIMEKGEPIETGEEISLATKEEVLESEEDLSQAKERIEKLGEMKEKLEERVKYLEEEKNQDEVEKVKEKINKINDEISKLKKKFTEAMAERGIREQELAEGGDLEALEKEKERFEELKEKVSKVVGKLEEFRDVEKIDENNKDMAWKAARNFKLLSEKVFTAKVDFEIRKKIGIEVYDGLIKEYYEAVDGILIKKQELCDNIFGRVKEVENEIKRKREEVVETEGGAGTVREPGTVGEEESKISRKDWERMDNIDDSLENVEKTKEAIRKRRNINVSEEEVALEKGDRNEQLNISVSMEVGRIVKTDMEFTEIELELERIETLLRGGEISSEEKKELEKRAPKMKERKREILIERGQCINNLEGSLRSAILMLEKDTKEAENKISGEKKGALNKLTFWLFGGKEAEVGETEASISEPAESGTETPPAETVPTKSEKSWVYRITHPGKMKREEKLGRAEKRIGEAGDVNNLRELAKDCADESKFNKKFREFFGEFEDRLESWSKEENADFDQRENEFSELAKKMGELRNNNKISEELVMMASAFFDKAKGICSGVESASVETPLLVEDIDGVAVGISEGEEAEAEEKKKEIAEKLLKSMDKSSFSNLHEEFYKLLIRDGHSDLESGVEGVKLVNFLSPDFEPTQKIYEEMDKIKKSGDNEEIEILKKITIKDLLDMIPVVAETEIEKIKESIKKVDMSLLTEMVEGMEKEAGRLAKENKWKFLHNLLENCQQLPVKEEDKKYVDETLDNFLENKIANDKNIDKNEKIILKELFNRYKELNN